jgi:N-sulfoglucosamine sulfohydrolase
MPFPRVKGHTYDDAHRVPLVMRWPKGIVNPGRRVKDLVSFIDFAPTFLKLAGVAPTDSGMNLTGHSLADLLKDSPMRQRPILLIGRERNDVFARPGSEYGLGYPARGIRSGDFLYIRNFEPDRWPCGNPELGLRDTDGSPTKSLINALGPDNAYWQHAFGKRPAEQLFNVVDDPDCVKNLIADASLAKTAAQLRDRLTAELKRQNDPRVAGNGDQFDRYPSVKKPVAGWEQGTGARNKKRKRSGRTE